MLVAAGTMSLRHVRRLAPSIIIIMSMMPPSASIKILVCFFVAEVSGTRRHEAGRLRETRWPLLA